MGRGIPDPSPLGVLWHDGHTHSASETIARFHAQVKQHMDGLKARRRGVGVPTCPKAEENGAACRVTRKGLVWRPGGVKLGHGEASEPIAVQHCRCLRHGHFLDYPSFLVPRKHYAAEVVESALSARAQGRTLEEICSVQGLPDTSAVRRWVRDVMVRIPVLLVDVRKRSIKWLVRIPPNPNSQSARWRMPSPLDGERPFRSMANGDSAQAEFGVGAKRRRSLSRGEFMRHGSFFPCLATHRFSLQRDFGRRTNESIQQGVRDAGIANGVMPLLDGVLAGHEGRPDPSPIVNHFKEGVLTRPLERVQCPIVEDEKVSARQAGEHLEVGAV